MARVVLSGGPRDGEQFECASPTAYPEWHADPVLAPGEYHRLLHGPIGNLPPLLAYRLDDEIGGVRFYEFDREVPRV